MIDRGGSPAYVLQQHEKLTSRFWEWLPISRAGTLPAHLQRQTHTLRQ